MSQQPEELKIRVFGTTEEAVVDAEVLAGILQGIQHAVHIVAMDENNLDPASPNYVPQGIQKSFPVRCLLPQQGSYALPLQIGNPDDLTVPEAARKVMDRIDACLKGLVSAEHTPYLDLIRNRRYRIRLLDAFRTMLPKAGATWKLGVSRPQAEEITLTGDCVRNISTLKERLRQHETVAQTITGNLQAMDFEARKITILYPENNRELECFYDEELEPELWETRRGLVQVTGTVVVDAEDFPIKIQDVESIQPLDLSDFDIREVAYGESVLRFRPPLVLTPELTESKQHMTLRHDELDIDVIASTREELLVELHEQIGILWRNYAEADDAVLSPKARELKQHLLNRVQREERQDG